MIELNKKTQQDFLNREWVQKLLDAGVDMSDAKYCIYRLGSKDFIYYLPSFLAAEDTDDEYDNSYLPTYTVSELMYKLHEWIHPTIDGKEYSGGLHFIKDAPFYVFWYDLKTKDYNKLLPSDHQVGEWNESYICAEYEYPIESLASMLIQCHKKDTGIKDRNGNQVSDVGDIRSK